MTTTPTTAVTFVQAASMLAAHLADHALPEPASLTVITRNGHPEVTAQLRSNTVPSIAADLVTWADTLSMVTVGAWRPPHGDRVHLSIRSSPTGSTGPVGLHVFGGADHDPRRFADLEAGDQRTVSLGELRTWTVSASQAKR
ncbi:MAG TPA: hypothetical protein VIY28_09915 [Pseudonocardiaceae bacterium]